MKKIKDKQSSKREYSLHVLTNIVPEFHKNTTEIFRFMNNISLQEKIHRKEEILRQYDES